MLACHAFQLHSGTKKRPASLERAIPLPGMGLRTAGSASEEGVTAVPLKSESGGLLQGGNGWRKQKTLGSVAHCWVEAAVWEGVMLMKNIFSLLGMEVSS